MKKGNICYECRTVFNDESIRRMFRAEYYTYETARRLLRFALGMSGVLAAFFFHLPTAARVLCLMLGVWLLVSGDFPSKIQAEGIIGQRGGKESQVRYRLDVSGIQIEGGGRMSYRGLDKLRYDDEWLYLFMSRQNAAMLRIDALYPAEPEELMKLVAKGSGLKWKRLSAGILEYNLWDLLQTAPKKHKREN